MSIIENSFKSTDDDLETYLQRWSVECELTDPTDCFEPTLHFVSFHIETDHPLTAQSFLFELPFPIAIELHRQLSKVIKNHLVDFKSELDWSAKFDRLYNKENAKLTSLEFSKLMDDPNS